MDISESKGVCSVSPGQLFHLQGQIRMRKWELKVVSRCFYSCCISDGTHEYYRCLTAKTKMDCPAIIKAVHENGDSVLVTQSPGHNHNFHTSDPPVTLAMLFDIDIAGSIVMLKLEFETISKSIFYRNGTAAGTGYKYYGCRLRCGMLDIPATGCTYRIKVSSIGNGDMVLIKRSNNDLS